MSRRRGRHARPSQAARNAKRAGAGSFAALTLMIPASDAVAAPGEVEPPVGEVDPMPSIEETAPPVEEAPEPTPVEPFTITVVPGDTLSEISATALGLPDWQPLYEQNRAVVGDNPDLILPGQVLETSTPVAPVAVEIEEESTVEEVAPVPQEEVIAAEAAVPSFGTAPIQNSAGPVEIRVQEAADDVFVNVRGASLITIGGTRSSARDPEGHPSGRALDYMVLGDAALGDAIAQYHRDNWDRLGVQYLIWQQRYLDSPGGGWQWMEDRGSGTQNHYDHVHVNYH